MIIHIGDFAYDMNGFLGGKGDLFMNEIQSVAARVPYNVAVGNHEHHNNFSEFAGRFTGPAPSVFYHSFNVGPLHIIMFSAEFYFFINFGTEQLQVRPAIIITSQLLQTQIACQLSIEIDYHER